MAGSHDIGATKAAVYSLLNSNLATMFNTIDTEKGDGITLNDIQHYYLSEKRTVDEYPASLIMGDRAEPVNDELRYGNEVHTIIVAIVETDDDEERLTKRIERSIWAVQRVVEADRTLGGNADYTFIGVKEFSPMFVAEAENVLLQEGHIVLEVRVSS